MSLCQSQSYPMYSRRVQSGGGFPRKEQSSPLSFCHGFSVVRLRGTHSAERVGSITACMMVMNMIRVGVVLWWWIEGGLACRWCSKINEKHWTSMKSKSNTRMVCTWWGSNTSYLKGSEAHLVMTCRVGFGTLSWISRNTCIADAMICSSVMRSISKLKFPEANMSRMGFFV